MYFYVARLSVRIWTNTHEEWSWNVAGQAVANDVDPVDRWTVVTVHLKENVWHFHQSVHRSGEVKANGLGRCLYFFTLTMMSCLIWNAVDRIQSISGRFLLFSFNRTHLALTCSPGSASTFEFLLFARNSILKIKYVAWSDNFYYWPFTLSSHSHT